MTSDDMSPDLERKLEETVTSIVTVVFWVLAVCLSVFVVALTIVGLVLLWKLI